MGRPRKPAIGSEKWAQNELKIAEQRLRDVRRLLETAGEAELPSLLRLEAALRRECERLARLSTPTVLTDWCANSRELEAAILAEEGDDE